MVLGMNQCTAKSKQSGKRCERAAMHGSTVCYMHGGKSPKGIASSSFQTGKYSKYLPERLLERYHNAVADTQLLELDHEIALVDSRLADLLTRVDTGEAGKLWEKAQRANDDIRKALHNENYGGVMIASEELDRLIGDRLVDYQAWTEISAQLDQRRRLVESQRKRLVEQQQMITAEQAMLFVTAVIDTVRRNVTDKGALQAISIDIAKLTAVNATVKNGN